MKDLRNILNRVDLSELVKMHQARQSVRSNVKYSIDKKAAAKKKRAATQMQMSHGRS